METIIFSGNSNKQLAKNIAKQLGNETLGKIQVSQFSDDETQVVVETTVRGKDVFIVQSTSQPANHYFMELLIMIDAIKRSGPKSITTIIPYYGYSRQDRRMGFTRVPITSALTAEMLTVAGVDTVITMDLHAQQIQGFFKCQIINITAKFVMIDHIERTYGRSCDDIVMVSPDVGGVTRTREIAKRVCGGTELAIVDKRRPKANVSQVMNIVGDVRGKKCIIVDDIVDTAGTLCKAADALIKNGATEVLAYCTHAVLSGNALENLSNSELTKLVVTDTIALSDEKSACDKIEIIPTGGLFADTIRRLRSCDSVSQLYVD